MAVIPAFGAPYLAVHRVFPRRKEAAGSTEVLEVANLWSAIPAWEHRDAVAAAIVDRGVGPADEVAGATAVVGVGNRGVVAVELVVPTDCEDVSGCRLRDWRDCCDRKRYPSLRDPSGVQRARVSPLSSTTFL